MDDIFVGAMLILKSNQTMHSCLYNIIIKTLVYTPTAGEKSRKLSIFFKMYMLKRMYNRDVYVFNIRV